MIELMTRKNKNKYTVDKIIFKQEFVVNLSHQQHKIMHMSTDKITC